MEEAEARARQAKLAQINARAHHPQSSSRHAGSTPSGGAGTLARDEWMLTPGKQGLSHVLGKPMTSRTFLRACDVVEEAVPAPPAVLKRKHAEDQARIDAHTRHTRGPVSLMDRHAREALERVVSGDGSGGGGEDGAGAGQPLRPFEWERDMGLKRGVSLQERDKMVREARGLGDKFTRGRQDRHFL
jgi:hypothetical protein